MDADQTVTLGEVFRLCQRMSEQLDAIDRRQQETDRRVDVLWDRDDRVARRGGVFGAIGGVLGGFIAGLFGRAS